MILCLSHLPLMMEAAGSYEKWVNICKTIQQHILEDNKPLFIIVFTKACHRTHSPPLNFIILRCVLTLSDPEPTNELTKGEREREEQEEQEWVRKMTQEGNRRK
jgi:hypothetical protein